MKYMVLGDAIRSCCLRQLHDPGVSLDWTNECSCCFPICSKAKCMFPRHRQKNPTTRACHREGKHSQPSIMLPGLTETQTALSPAPLGWQRQEVTHVGAHVTLSHPMGPQLTSCPSQWALPTHPHLSHRHSTPTVTLKCLHRPSIHLTPLPKSGASS